MPAATVETPSPGVPTPETYLGALRAEGWTNRPAPPRRRAQGDHRHHDFGRPEPGANEFSFGGSWEIGQEEATSGRLASIEAGFGASKVFLVLGSPNGPRRVQVLLDGRPIPERLAGEDVNGGVATISAQRLYRLVDLPRAESHRLTLRFAPGISGYAFTFG